MHQTFRISIGDIRLVICPTLFDSYVCLQGSVRVGMRGVSKVNQRSSIALDRLSVNPFDSHNNMSAGWCKGQKI